jgi:putative phosphoesterase
MARTVIGVISDTHGLFRPEIRSIFAGVDLIVHAGDVGGASVLNELSKIAPVEAVFGNVDDSHDPMLARERSIPAGGLTIHVSHGHELGQPTAERVLERYRGDVLVFGHTHRAVIVRHSTGRLVINPGSAGPRRFSVEPSVALLTIANGIAEAAIVNLSRDGVGR